MMKTELPKTRLVYKDGVLTRYTKAGEPLAEFTDEQLESISIKVSVDKAVVVFAVVIFVLAGCAFSFVNTAWLSNTVAILLGLFGCVLCFGAVRHDIVLQCGGEQVEIDVQDDGVDASLFVLSIQQNLSNLR